MRFFHTTILAVIIATATPVVAAGQDIGSVSLPERGEESAVNRDIADNAVLMRQGLALREMNAVLENVERSEALTTRGAADAKLYSKVAPAVVMVVTEDGIGSGSVISENGLVLTNWHVIEGFAFVGIVFKPESPGTDVRASDIRLAEVIRIDQVADLALLRMKDELPSGIRPIPLADTKGLNVGDDVHAIGHPSNNGWTYTKGFISQIHPKFSWTTSSGVLHEAAVIQTQTPINPGNSGGPLLNDRAEMIGVNSFVSEGEGLNFAVSADSIREFLTRSADRMAEAVPKPRNPQNPCGEVETLFEGRTKDNDGDLIAMDTNCDGKEDTVLHIPDRRAESIQLIIYNQRTGEIEGVVYDEDRDEKWDFSLWDTDGDGEADVEGIHPNGDVRPVSFRKL